MSSKKKESIGVLTAQEDLKRKNGEGRRIDEDYAVLRLLNNATPELRRGLYSKTLAGFEAYLLAKAETLRQQCIALEKLDTYLQSNAEHTHIGTEVVSELDRRKSICLETAFQLGLLPPKTLDLTDDARPVD